jgi:tetratricopeptide (TPR) repeat protein
MAKSKNIDLTEDGVITQEALLAYAQGRLSDAERTQMDKLLKDDPFAQDALEGMRQAPAQAEISSAVTSLNTQLREKTGLRERKKKGIEIHWANYAYAAVVLGVLVGVGYVMIHVLSNNAREEALNKSVPQAQVSVPVIEEKKKEEPKIDSAKLLAEAAKNDTTKNNSESAAAVTATVNADIAEQKPAAATASAISSTEPGTATAAKLSAAQKVFESGDYAEAEKKYNEILATQPNNADALYFGGVSSFLNGSKGYGEANFDKLAKSTYYPEGTKWYRANILIKKGRKDEAKQMLRDLVNSNSSFKDRAIKTYEELYK